MGSVTSRTAASELFRSALASATVVQMPGDEFHGVQQQLLLDVRVLVVLVEFGMPGSDAAEHLVRHGGQFTGLGVDERQLPFHAKSRLPG